MHSKEASVWLEQLYDENYTALCRMLRSHMYKYNRGDMAEDIAQDVFAQAYAEYEELKNHPNIRGWLYQNAYFRCHNQIRREENALKHTAFAIDDEASAAIEDPMAQVSLEACLLVTREEALAYLREHLSEKDYRLFTEATSESADLKTLSQEYGLSDGAVKMRLHRVKKNARKILSVFFRMFVTLAILLTCN